MRFYFMLLCEEFKGKENEVLPIILLCKRKMAAYLYARIDLAAVIYRSTALKADRVLYVVDARQSLHFQQIFALAYRAGFADAHMQLEYISFGMVEMIFTHRGWHN